MPVQYSSIHHDFKKKITVRRARSKSKKLQGMMEKLVGKAWKNIEKLHERFHFICRS